MGNRDEARQTILEIIERRSFIDSRFESISRIDAEGGGGAFSVLVTAHDRILGIRVALKFFDPRQRLSGNQYRWSSFQREAALLSRFVGQQDILQSIAPVSEFTETFVSGGLSWPVPFAYHATELASGDVGHAIAMRVWSAKERLEQFRVMCRAVQRIHKHGVVHRDLKPGNFLVMADGTLRLSDFGTARCLTDKSEPIEQTYAVPPGDLRYAAPEMIACLHDVDPRFAFKADVYALGAVLFEMFCGSQLNLYIFDSATLADLNRTMNAVSREDRLRIYHQFIAEMADSHPLPSLRVLGSDAPSCILPLLNTLYMNMSAIDYRRRLGEFDHVFLQINRCLLILKHEIRYQEWRKKRAAVRQAAEKRRRMPDSSGRRYLC